ncbi:MAG: helix-turn-helix domain-containing protein [Pseudonocardiaceae bacterium]|nr:helix-turn-helix domain-containing protein [Pseudonocardiaceae bacterium]
MTRNHSLIRGMGLLRALAARPSGATVPELAEVTDLPRSTIARLLATLHELGAVERQDSRVWILGPEVARIGRVADPFQALRERGYETVRRLSQEFHESAMIAVVYENWETETILQADAPNLVGATSWLGKRHGGVLHAAATGKLALARLSDDELRRHVTPLRAFTSATITSVDALAEELERVRAQGWATTIDELELGLTAVAVTIEDAVVAAGAGARSLSLSLSGLSARLDVDRIPAIVEQLTAAAQRLARGARTSSGDAPHE